MRSGKDLGGKRWIALIASMCTLGSLAVAPAANAATTDAPAASTPTSQTRPVTTPSDTTSAGATTSGTAASDTAASGSEPGPDTNVGNQTVSGDGANGSDDAEAGNDDIAPAACTTLSAVTEDGKLNKTVFAFSLDNKVKGFTSEFKKTIKDGVCFDLVFPHSDAYAGVHQLFATDAATYTFGTVTIDTALSQAAGTGPFSKAKHIDKVVIGPHVASIPASVFKNANVESLQFEDRTGDGAEKSLTIAGSAFQNSTLTSIVPDADDYTFPQGLESLTVGADAFARTQLTLNVLRLPNLTTLKIGNTAFKRYASAKYPVISSVEFPKSVAGDLTIQNAAFSMSGLNSVSFPDEVKGDLFIDQDAFRDNNLSTVDMGNTTVDGNLNIAMGAFKDNINLRNVVLPKSVGSLTMKKLGTSDNTNQDAFTPGDNWYYSYPEWNIKVTLPQTITKNTGSDFNIGNDLVGVIRYPAIVSESGKVAPSLTIVVPENVDETYWKHFSLSQLAGITFQDTTGKPVVPNKDYVSLTVKVTNQTKQVMTELNNQGNFWPILAVKRSDANEPLMTGYFETGRAAMSSSLWSFAGFKVECLADDGQSYVACPEGDGSKVVKKTIDGVTSYAIEFGKAGYYQYEPLFEPTDLLKQLQTKVDQVSKLYKDSYTYDSWKAVDEKLAAAKAVLANATATKDQVSTALSELQAAVDKLVRRPSSGGGSSTGPTYVTGLTVSSHPNKTEYKIGESFDTTGMVIKYQPSNGSAYVLGSDQYTVAFDSSKPGKVKAYITLNSDPTKATTVEMTVVVSDVTVHRLYNPKSGEHFYVSSETEYNALVRSGAWRDEGTAFTMADYGTSVYRLYNPGGKHLFTTSEKERDVLKAAGWNYEGVAFRVPEGSKTEVHRLYNTRNGDHLLTMSVIERTVLKLAGWRDEGVAFTAK